MEKKLLDYFNKYIEIGLLNDKYINSFLNYMVYKLNNILINNYHKYVVGRRSITSNGEILSRYHRQS